ncbi:MAG: hypothetical protein AAFP92_22330, partial [Bacteroidota bacterium]
MKNILAILCWCCFGGALLGQELTPQTAPLPEKFQGLEPLIEVTHFPSPVKASVDPDRPGSYFWK